MNNEMNKPVAWMFKHKKVVDFNKPDVWDDNWIPLYTYPVKELTLSDEEIMDIKTLMEINYGCVPPLEFAWAILRKAQEK